MSKRCKRPTDAPFINVDFYMMVYNHIKQGHNPNQIAIKLNKSRQAVNWYIKRLKDSGHIEKVGYGTWKTTKKDVKVGGWLGGG